MKIICVGRNYNDHIKELKNQKPQSPVLFIKPDTSLCQPNLPFYIPNFTNDVQYEAEVIILINRIGKHIQTKFAHKYYDKVSLGIDFTARDLQNELKSKGLPWEKSKSFDGSALIGKWYSKEIFFDINNTPFKLLKNNRLVQKSNTSSMIWSVDELISYASKFFTLKIGDIIFTGTPSGVGTLKKEDDFQGFIGEKIALSFKVK